MPIYEYKCKSCEKISEFTMKMSDPHPDTCPSCGSSKNLVKLISQTAFQLRGGGWYNQSYDGKSNQKAEKSESAPSSESKSTSKESSAPTPAAAPASSGSDTKS